MCAPSPLSSCWTDANPTDVPKPARTKGYFYPCLGDGSMRVLRNAGILNSEVSSSSNFHRVGRITIWSLLT